MAARKQLWSWVLPATLAAGSMFGARAAGFVHSDLVREVQASQAVELRELMQSGASTRVQIELKAHGLYRPGLPPASGADGAEMPKPRGSKCRRG